MSYLHYQYCLSDFVLAEDYQTEYFAKESDGDNLDNHYHKVMLQNVSFYTPQKRKKLEGLLRRIYISKEEIVRYINKEKEFFAYDPLNETPELYLEMNKIEIFNETSLLKFIKNYGIPYHQQIPKGETGVFPTVLFQQNETKKFIIAMDTLMFYEKLFKFQNTLKMWNSIKEDNIEEMTKIKEDFKIHAEFYGKHQAEFTKELSLEQFAEFVFADLGFTYRGEIEEVFEGIKHDSDKILKLSEKASELKIMWEQVKNTDLKNIAFAYLNLKLKEIKSGKTSTRFIDGKIVPAIHFNNLLEVAGYQLKQAIFKDEQLQKCLHCGALFEPKHARQKFCSPLPNRGRSTCENTYNQRLKRQRRKEKEKQK
jgi:hypothetical protein